MGDNDEAQNWSKIFHLHNDYYWSEFALLFYKNSSTLYL